VCALALVATACGASGDDGANENEEESTETTAPAADSATFGDLPSPCGEGDATVADGEGPATDTLQLGVANDRSAQIRPGLNKEFWDTAQAFAKWCNDQGGIQGLPIELVDLDGQVTAVEAAMTKACTEVFAMVGGGFAQDQLEFSGKDGSDFHKCGLIDIPAFAVSIEKSLSNGKVEPLPNPADQVSTQWVQDFKALYPDETEQLAIVYGELPSMTTVKAQFNAAAEKEGVTVVEEITYPIIGADDWGPYADLVIDSGATSLYWIGEPANAANLSAKLNEKGWEGVILHQTNAYDAVLFSFGNEGVEGSVLRTAFHPFEEADDWPAIADYLEIVNGATDDAAIGPLGMQGFSAWLLFATAANACGELNDAVLDRTCILEQAAAVEDWTGGGLHAPTDPDAFDRVKAGPCGMLLVVRDGAFERLYPEVGGEGDDIAGFHCPEDGVTEVTATGAGVVDPDRPI
jgi:ABC-type branched-subunit amino acid transport system substrate-binding protein